MYKQQKRQLNSAVHVMDIHYFWNIYLQVINIKHAQILKSKTNKNVCKIIYINMLFDPDILVYK